MRISDWSSDVCSSDLSFTAEVQDWLAEARHPTSGRLYTDMVFQPMIELLDYLRANDFEVYIVSGGGVDFMRAFAEEAYGVPPENVIGSNRKSVASGKSMSGRVELSGRSIII